VELILNTEGSEFRIQIIDNGIGMRAKSSSASGMGMAILKNRADTLGAEIIYSEREQGGTSMLCRMETVKS
jgi:nitrate/nitrite-specific signal transduction histidine kinase